MHEHWEFVAVLFYSWPTHKSASPRSRKAPRQSYKRVPTRRAKRRINHVFTKIPVITTATVSSWLNNIESITLSGCCCCCCLCFWLTWTPHRSIQVRPSILIRIHYWGTYCYNIITYAVHWASQSVRQSSTAKHGTEAQFLNSFC